MYKYVHATNIVREVVVVFGFSGIEGLGKVSRNCFQGGDCWVVKTHTLGITFVWAEVSQAFGFPYA